MNKDYKEDVWSGFADLLATLIEKLLYQTQMKSLLFEIKMMKN